MFPFEKWGFGFRVTIFNIHIINNIPFKMQYVYTICMQYVTMQLAFSTGTVSKAVVAMNYWLKHCSHLWALCLNQVSSSEIKLTYFVQAFHLCGGGTLQTMMWNAIFVNKRPTHPVFYSISFPSLVLHTLFNELWPSVKYVNLVKTSSQRSSQRMPQSFQELISLLKYKDPAQL